MALACTRAMRPALNKAMPITIFLRLNCSRQVGHSSEKGGYRFQGDHMKRKIKYVWVSARGSFEQAGSGEVDAYAATDHVESRHGFERCIEGAVRRLHLTGMEFVITQSDLILPRSARASDKVVLPVSAGAISREVPVRTDGPRRSTGVPLQSLVVVETACLASNVLASWVTALPIEPPSSF
jgi:hypothetical protein